MKLRCTHCQQRREAPKWFRRDAYSKSGFRQPCKKCLGVVPCNTNRIYATAPPSYEKHKQRTGDRQRRLRNEMIAAYGGRCTCCGESEPKFLTLDHVNSDGAEHRRQVGRGASFYAWLKREGYPRDRFQLHCANCNHAKAFYGRCPHQNT